MDMKKMLAALDGVESAEGTSKSSAAGKGSMKALLESLDSVVADEVIDEETTEEVVAEEELEEAEEVVAEEELEEAAEEELEEAIMVSAEGDEAAELLAILQNAGMAAPAMPEPEMEMQDEYSNSPDEQEMDLDAVIASGDDMHREKDQFAAAADGDNPMKAFEGKLQAMLDEMLAEGDEAAEEVVAEETAEEVVEATDEEIAGAGTFVGINTKTGDFESGLSHEEVTSGRFTHMLPDDTTYFDPDTAEELVGAPDEEMEAMGWEKVMSEGMNEADDLGLSRFLKMAGV